MATELSNVFTTKINFQDKQLEKVIQEVKELSFAEEIENDKSKVKMLLARPKQARATKASPEIIEQEEKSSAVYKRVLLLVGSSNMQVNSASGETKLAAENKLPISSYLNHGSRVLIEIPKGDNSELINWLTSGDKDIDGRSKKQSQEKAIKEKKIIYSRSAATHAVKFKKNINGELEPIEKKGFAIGAKDFLANKIFSADTPHWGVDLALNAEFNKKDSLGVTVAKPDGDHGHLYVYYNPSNYEMPGALMTGVEGGAPTSKKHSKSGAINPLSAIDGSKFSSLDAKARGEEYQDVIIPKTLGGMMIKLTKEQIEEIVRLKDKDYGVELAHAVPCKSPQELVDCLKELQQSQPKKQALPDLLQDLPINLLGKAEKIGTSINNFISNKGVSSFVPHNHKEKERRR